MMNATAATSIRAPIDIHVHIVGNGSSGSGCWIQLGGWNRVLARLMLTALRLPQSALRGDLDRLYVSRLLEYVRGSSLSSVVILAHERVYDDCGKLLPQFGSMYVPNDYVLQLGREHPEFLPAVSVHPARPDALDELDRSLEQGAVLLKFLPNCQNIDCSNPKYRPFWKKMADAGLPLLAHTGGELTVQVVERKYENPEYLRGPLDCGVTVIAAHVASRSYPGGHDYLPAFCRLCREYPHLYGDNSALCTPFRSAALKTCLTEELLPRLLHGSDLPVPVSGRWARYRGVLPAQDAKEWQKCDNLLERDYRFKCAMGFPDEVFTRAHSLLRVPKRESA
jgi:predicted TIM-barrel fold metal-dependent hydrolase